VGIYSLGRRRTQSACEVLDDDIENADLPLRDRTADDEVTSAQSSNTSHVDIIDIALLIIAKFVVDFTMATAVPALHLVLVLLWSFVDESE
jgi:hypothetical protein